MAVRDILKVELDRHRPALEYLANVERNQRRRAYALGIELEIRELERVIAGDFREDTKDYCRSALVDLRRRLEKQEVP